jgi:hypothetical protein
VGDAAQLVLAVAALVSALGGSLAGVIAAIRSQQQAARGAAETAAQLAGGRHVRNEDAAAALRKELTDLLAQLEAPDDSPAQDAAP